VPLKAAKIISHFETQEFPELPIFRIKYVTIPKLKGMLNFLTSDLVTYSHQMT